MRIERASAAIAPRTITVARAATRAARGGKHDCTSDNRDCTRSSRHCTADSHDRAGRNRDCTPDDGHRPGEVRGPAATPLGRAPPILVPQLRMLDHPPYDPETLRL